MGGELLHAGRQRFEEPKGFDAGAVRGGRVYNDFPASFKEGSTQAPWKVGIVLRARMQDEGDSSRSILGRTCASSKNARQRVIAVALDYSYSAIDVVFLAFKCFSKMCVRFPFHQRLRMLPVAEWMGLDADQVASVFPNIAAFNSSLLLSSGTLFIK